MRPQHMRPQIALSPKPVPQKSSWWAGTYPNRACWYAASHMAASRLRGSQALTPGDCGTDKFGDYWKKPKPDGAAWLAHEEIVIA